MFDVSKGMISLKPAHKVKPQKLRLMPHLPGRDGAPSPWQCGWESVGCGVWGSATALKPQTQVQCSGEGQCLSLGRLESQAVKNLQNVPKRISTTNLHRPDCS